LKYNFQVDKRIYERALTETLIFRAKHQEFPKSQIVVIYPRRAVDKGAGMLAPLVESELIRVIYLDEATKNELHDAGLLLLRLISSASNPEADKETVQRLKKTIHKLPQAGKHREFLIDFFVRVFLEKYKHLTEAEVKAMIDFTKEFDVSESLAVRQYAARVAKKAAQKGERKGIQKGERRGLQKGERRGLQKGLRQGKLSAVPKMRKMGLSDKEIADALSLPITTIRKHRAR
jgi:predicted transposase YdaD